MINAQNPTVLTLTRLLGWSVEEYNKFQYDSAIAWLRWWFNGDSPFSTHLEETSEFWRDWTRLFNQRNMQVLRKINLHAAERYPDEFGDLMVSSGDRRLRRITRELFTQTHNAEAINECPSRITLERIGARLVGELIDKIHNNESRELQEATI